MSLRRTGNKYTYKKISDLVEPDKKVNIYGVIHTIVKVKLILNLAYCVQLLNNIAVWFESVTAESLIKGARIVQLITVNMQ